MRLEGKLAELFREYWWVLFPLAGLAGGFIDMVLEERRANAVIERARRGLEGK
jgi:hypothetical protein